MSTPSTEQPSNLAQVIAAELWNAMKRRGMTYEDICNVCAVLLLNVAEKTESTPQEIAGLVSEKMGAEAKKQQRIDAKG
jgi:hypothetical protein